MWETGKIPAQLQWVITVLMPKGNGDFRRIGSLDLMWKVVEGIMDDRFSAIALHDCLQGFVNSSVIGTAIIEVKLV